jgi:hypothetical protein
MTQTPHDEDRWEAANAEFLAASLAWLRLVLLRHHDLPAESTPDASRPEARSNGLSCLFKRSTRPDIPQRPASDEQIEQAAAAVAETENVTPPPALVELADRLGLSRFERDVVLLCAAVEIDPAVVALCARLHGNDQMRYPTFGLAMAVLPNPAWDVVSPQRGLRFWKLIDITQRAGEGVVTASLRADERIVNYLKGLNYLDDRLTPLLTRVRSQTQNGLPPSQSAISAKIAREWDTGSPVAPIIQLAGPDQTGKQVIIADAATQCGLFAFLLPAALLPSQPVELDNLARLWERESLLLPLALCIDAHDLDDDPGGSRPPLGRFLSRISGRVAVASRESRPDLTRPSLVLDVEPPTVPERASAWRSSLGIALDSSAVDSLAEQFAVEISDIHEIASLTVDPDDAWRECRVRTRPTIDALAQRLEPRVEWDDIVLPDTARGLLEQIADQMSQRAMVYEQWGFGARIQRGLGVSVLFAGPSGTGKTMAAEVLAARLRLDLYRIDLSAVVSKYIGETEKNLRRLFDAAEGGGAILFFDEADALFGKRSEVKDAHDRYANIEINYLLQRMEAYRGLAILATNMRSALDAAFVRRLRFIVEFPFPGVAERRAIWEKSFPDTAPVGQLDFDRLAQLPVTGGMVRNIAVNAAFLAATAGSEITMEHVLAAARTEFEKLELPIREREFADRAVSRR